MMDGMTQIRLIIADKLLGIERVCKAHNLSGMTRFTLVGRDPYNPHMVIVVTNEPDEPALREAFDEAINNTAPTREATDHDMRVGIPLPMPLVDDRGEVARLMDSHANEKHKRLRYQEALYDILRVYANRDAVWTIREIARKALAKEERQP